MLISIDHGNKQVKSAHLKPFSSALYASDSRPPIGEDYLQYGSKFYAVSDQRIPYHRDKTLDDDFFILSLFAIAREIEQAGCYSDREVMDVQLAVGLPPADVGSLSKRFSDYFTKRGLVKFRFRDKPYTILIDEVRVYPQAYAAAMTIFHEIYTLPRTVIVDIGGFTVDYMIMKKGGEIDLDKCDSLEEGVITLYNKVQSVMRSEHDLLLEESDIDSVLYGEGGRFGEAVELEIRQQAREFVGNLMANLRERKIDLRAADTVFVGGGAALLRSYIESSDKIGHCIFVQNICANALGYETLFRIEKKAD